MPRSLRFLARFAALFAVLQLAAQPVAAQSILRDAETEKLLQDMMDPLTIAAGMPKGSVQVVLLQDNTLNAFVAGGQRIYVHSGLIEAAGAKSLGTGCAEPLGRDVIHSVTNPLDRLTAAIHVYGGDFYGGGRSDWDPETLLERDYDYALHRRMFEEANAAV